MKELEVVCLPMTVDPFQHAHCFSQRVGYSRSSNSEERSPCYENSTAGLTYHSSKSTIRGVLAFPKTSIASQRRPVTCLASLPVRLLPQRCGRNGQALLGLGCQSQESPQLVHFVHLCVFFPSRALRVRFQGLLGKLCSCRLLVPIVPI